jgi:hypothetical protein
MRISGEKKSILFIIVLLTITGISIAKKGLSIQKQTQDSLKNEYIKKWQESLIKEPLVKGSKQLILERYFPEEDKIKDDVFLAQARFMCIDDNENIYVADSKANRILKFDFEGNNIFKIGQPGQGPGEFKNPRYIFSDNKDNIYVENNGNGRIDLFNKDGKYNKSAKIFKYYSCYACDSNGRIYANYMNSKLDEENLIEILNNDGSLEQAFGNRIKFKYNTRTHNEVLISIEDKYLYLLWKNFNVLRKYSMKGELLKEYKILNDKMDELSNNNDLMMKPINNGVTSRVLFGGMYAKGDNLYVSKIGPRLEIYEVNGKGEIVNAFWYGIEYDYIGNGLIVVNKNSKRYFVTMQIYPNNRIEIYTEKK